MDSLFLYLFVTMATTVNSIIFKKQRNLLIFTAAILLSLTYGLRVGIGNDYAQYENIYKQIKLGSYSAIEPTYILLTNMLNSFDNGFNYLMVIYSFLTFIFCYIGIRKYDIYSYVPILMFSTGFIFFVDNQVRQALATAFFIYYMRFISTREFGKYAICVVISTIFAHFSSAILIFCYFIKKKRVSELWWILFIAIAYIIMKFDVVNFLLSKIISIVPYYSDLYLQRFSSMKIEETGSGLGVIFWLLMATFAVVYSREVDDVVLVNLFLVGTIINTIFINYDIFERVSFYFIYLRFIILALIIKKIMFRSYIDFMLSILIISLTLMFSSYEIINNSNKHGSVPFSTLYFKAES